jgi:hypothetical protein
VRDERQTFADDFAGLADGGDRQPDAYFRRQGRKTLQRWNVDVAESDRTLADVQSANAGYFSR